MKLRSIFLFAAAIAITTVGALSANPAYAERSYGQPSERVAQRSPLTPEQRKIKHAERVAKFKKSQKLDEIKARRKGQRLRNRLGRQNANS